MSAEMVPATEIVATVRDGDEHGWNHELVWLWTHQPDQMSALIADINENGVREPVVIAHEEGGPRMWDGHHRVAAALALGSSVPVVHVHPRVEGTSG